MLEGVFWKTSKRIRLDWNPFVCNVLYGQNAIAAHLKEFNELCQN